MCGGLNFDALTFSGDFELNKLFTYKGSRKNKNVTDGHQKAVCFPDLSRLILKVLGVAISFDGIYLATCGADKLIKIWDTNTNTLKETFQGHRDAVTVF